MNAWIIETSTERGVLAFLNDQEISFVKEFPVGYDQSKHLIPYLKMAYESPHLASFQLDCIAVGIGPGSYTGIRVGVSVAKSLAYAWNVPLIGFCTLSAYIPSEEGPFAALIDAKIGGAYFLKGVFEKGKVFYTTEPQVCPLSELGSHLEEVRMIVTPCCKGLKTKLDQLYPQYSWKWVETSPSIPHLGDLIQKKYKNSDWSLDGHLDLLYLRQTEAERERLKSFSEKNGG
jgi:tRNA threonylcarbamoyladenosine biosynthesis protein TsaB